MSNDFQVKEHFSCSNAKNSTAFGNHISQLVYEMVEITAKTFSERSSDNNNWRAQKSVTVLKSISEKETPVRRSNRIRRTVVKKDEFITPRQNKKTNKSQKNSELPVLKTSEKELINSSDHNKINESCNKEISKNKSCSKLSKTDKVTKNSNQLFQKEKKKTSRRGKTLKTNENLQSEDHTNRIIDSEFKYDNPQMQPLSLASSCIDALNDISKTEVKSLSNMQKLSDDQNSETNDKVAESCNKPVKVKSRWWRSSELEAVMNSESENPVTDSALKKDDITPCVNAIKILYQASDASNSENVKKIPVYEHIEENIYRFNRKKCKSKKQVRRMVCDCTLTKEELENGMLGCKEECLNRLLMIECGSRCPIGEACSNKKFQKKQYVRAELIKTEKKGWGLRSLEDISVGDFVLEFVGEVLNHKEYRQRVKQYAKEKNVHSYFMALKTDEILDATSKGNFSRFINHSCSPNCETQKWTVNGELRVGIFAKRLIGSGEELTLDYQFQRYGREAQKCYCGADICSGFIGGAKQISIDAYSSTKQQMASRKRKGSEDKKRDMEDMIFEEELEKLSGSKGLRNRDDTLKLARLMVRADDPNTRHQLLNIILKTDQPACLRLFLDYHGLSLLWSWMTDVMELNLKAKILQVLSLLPITNKTMLLDSKVISIVEKWKLECSANPAEAKDTKFVGSTECAVDSTKKLKVAELSDSETDSTSSHTITDAFNDAKTSADEGSLLEEYSDHSCPAEMNISSIAIGLLKNWNNLKEVFRIPRLEQQKRKEDELEVDNRAKEQDKERQQPPSSSSAYNEVSLKCGDQIQVVISGKNVLNDHLRDMDYDYESPGTKLDSGLRRFNQSRVLPIMSKTRHPVTKPIRAHHLAYPPLADSDESKHSRKGEEALPHSLCIPEVSPHQLPPDSFPPPVYSELPFMPPPTVESAPPPIVFPPQIMFPPSQVPFMGSTPSILPHNPAMIPPPTSVTTQQPPPRLQQPPLQTAQMPMCQPGPVGAPPPCPNNFLLQQSVPPSSVVPPSQVQQPPMQSYPPPSVYSNSSQQQPLYFIPQQQVNNPPPASFPENIPLQPSSSTFPVQTLIPVMKEEPKPIRLPKNWRTATDSEGNVYYYHSITRETQWDPPSENEDESDEEDENSSSEESESSVTPTYDEPKVISTKHSRKKSKKRKPTKAAADTSVVPVRPEIAKKIKELFRTKISSFIVHCLNAYRKPSCSVGRITSNEDFKYLARKLTHYTMTKELKQCKNVEDLDCNETVMHKAKDFIKKYMAKYGSQYSRKEKSSPQEH